MLKLRPHHLLCMKFYEGKGYSDSFVNNMNKITENLKDTPRSDVFLIDSCDDLCEACPHKTMDGGCKSGQKIHTLDESVKATFNIKTNMSYSYQSLKTIIDTQLNSKNFKHICSDCEWYKSGVCKLN